MDLKPPLTIEQQIYKLKNHGMLIHDVRKAEQVLSTVNYYRFSGYALEYRKSPHDSDYIPCTNFNTIYNIYKFDEGLRNILRWYIEKTEIRFRTKIAYNFTLVKCTEKPYNQHYLPGNYYRKDKFINLLKRICEEEKYFQDSEFVKHHKNTYKDKMPLWVLVEIMTFSTLAKYYSCMYSSEQELIAKDVGTSARILRNNLHALAILRNKCAHAARLYNSTMTLPVAFRQQFLRCNPNIKNSTLFAYIVMLANYLPDNMCKAQFQNDLYKLVAKYENDIDVSLMGFPPNWDLLI